MLIIKPFDSGFKGLIGQVNEDFYFDSHEENGELSEELYDELYETLYSIEDNLLPFSREFPKRTFVYIYVDCHGGACYYKGFSVLNGEVLFKHAGMDKGHIPLLQTLSPDYKEIHFEPFTRNFLK
ncbi:MAG: hypothetical protein LIP01_01815 [Tannerellaceae bacterium]|nr:hypothetical protein [Tannerellaceae bacterium]